MQSTRQGRRKAGPSIEDVARLAGVSAQTVSRVSTGTASVRPETRAKVVSAMEQLGYSPNRVARALRSGHFSTIGVLSQSHNRTGETLSTQAVQRAATAAGYSVTMIGIDAPLGDGGPNPEQWQSAAMRLSNQAIDGLIILRAQHATPETLSLPAGMPVAVSDSRLIGYYPAVSSNQVQGARDATKHLLQLGHTSIHHIAGPQDSEPAIARQAAWQRTLELAGLTPPRVWQGDWSAKSGYLAGLEIAKDPHITAVFAANDEMAIGLIRALYEAGRRVPEDVSVVGFDNIDIGEFSFPPLTTVHQDFDRIGRELVGMVLEQLNSGASFTPRQRTVIPTELVLRGTTAAPPSSRSSGTRATSQ